jgi:hypothetical protein
LLASKVRTRNCATNSWLAQQPRSVAATIGAMRPTPAELEVARALIARVKAADPSMPSSGSTSCWCAPQSHVGQTSLAACPTLRSGDVGKNISRPKQVTDWVARLEKLEQTLAAESGRSKFAEAYRGEAIKAGSRGSRFSVRRDEGFSRPPFPGQGRGISCLAVPKEQRTTPLFPKRMNTHPLSCLLAFSPSIKS